MNTAAIREESLRVYRAGGLESVRRWMAEARVTLEDLRRAHAGDAAALQAIDTLLAPDADEDFETAVERHLAPLRGSPLYDVHRANLLNTSYAEAQLRWYEGFARIEGSRVLDVGAGAGAMLLALAGRGAALAVGLEVDPARHHLARLRTRGHPAVECVLSAGARIDYPDASFDVVVCCHVVEHVEDHAPFFREMARVLRPGGRAFVSCPNRLWPVEPHSGLPAVTWLPPVAARRLARAVAGAPATRGQLRSRFATLGEVRHFLSARTLARLVERFGFRVVTVNPEARFAAEHPRLARLAPAAGPARRALARLASWDLLVIAERDTSHPGAR